MRRQGPWVVRYSVVRFDGRRPRESVLIEGRVSTNARVWVNFVRKPLPATHTNFVVFVPLSTFYFLDRFADRARRVGTLMRKRSRS